MTHEQPIRILVIDDQESIHEDFRKIIHSDQDDGGLGEAAAALFGDQRAAAEDGQEFVVESAHQGQEGLAMVERALREGRPYPLAFVDVRMPPGWDGVETVRRIWEVDPEILVVLCTAYSDHTWQDIVRCLGRSDHLLILKKPFDNIEVQQLVMSLTKRWHLARQAELTRSQLERMVAARTADVEAKSRALQTAVEELRSANRRLREAEQAAVQASQAKSEFLANMSHEIRTPMTAILGYAGLLREEFDPSLATTEHAEYLDAIVRNAEHLLSLINNVLDISKIESGRLEAERSACSPFQIVASVISQMRGVAETKGLSLNLEYVNPIPETIRTNCLRLRQILINLLGNAVKFTDQGSVCLAVSFVPDEPRRPLLRFDVTDSGVGMSEEQLGRLFQRFSQADSSMTRRHGGAGLGLAISKRLAQILGGDIAVQTSLGRGSTFTVTIETGDLAGVRLLDGPRGETPAPQALVSSETAPSGGRVLLAEDAVDNQRLIARILTKGGWQVTVAENGQVAYDKALTAEQPFDLILMDVQMPVLDGHEATRRLRSAGYQGPIVALTANSIVGDREKCLEAGCDDYLPKPIDRQRLLEVAGRYLQGRANPAYDASQ